MGAKSYWSYFSKQRDLIAGNANFQFALLLKQAKDGWGEFGCKVKESQVVPFNLTNTLIKLQNQNLSPCRPLEKLATQISLPISVSSFQQR